MSKIIYEVYEDGSNACETSTHYKAVVLRDEKWVTKNPYSLYQLRDSQGYCQLFAFMLAKYTQNELQRKGYQRVKQPKDIHTIGFTTFEKISRNTHLVFQHFYDDYHEILWKKDVEYKKRLNKNYKELNKNKYGIKKRTSINTIMKQLRKMKVIHVMEYLSDNIWNTTQIQQKYKSKFTNINKKLEYYKQINYTDDKKDNKMSVRSTEGETIYESYQSIIAAIFASNIDDPSVYDYLAAKYGIKIERIMNNE